LPLILGLSLDPLRLFGAATCGRPLPFALHHLEHEGLDGRGAAWNFGTMPFKNSLLGHWNSLLALKKFPAPRAGNFTKKAAEVLPFLALFCGPNRSDHGNSLFFSLLAGNLPGTPENSPDLEPAPLIGMRSNLQLLSMHRFDMRFAFHGEVSLCQIPAQSVP